MLKRPEEVKDPKLRKLLSNPKVRENIRKRLIDNK
jgi:hypothetical protein